MNRGWLFKICVLLELPRIFSFYFWARLGHKLQMDYRMTLRRLQLKYYRAYLHLIFLNYYLGWGTKDKKTFDIFKTTAHVIFFVQGDP